MSIRRFVAMGFCVVSAPLFGQQPGATPRKDPFAGFGNTTLNQKTPGKSSLSVPSLPSFPSTTRPAQSPTTGPGGSTAAGGGLVLPGELQGGLTQSTGGQTMKMEDLKAVLSGYGTPALDTAAHPDVLIYEGPRLRGSSETCRIPYLMPQDKAEALLLGGRGIVTTAAAVAPGFPSGMTLSTYDIQASIYNRLCLITDKANQVVALQLKGEHKAWTPPVPPWVTIPRDWHTLDYVNTRNRGNPGIRIRTDVLDRRGDGKFIVVNSTVVSGPAETSTFYAPEPFVKMMLYCLSRMR